MKHHHPSICTVLTASALLAAPSARAAVSVDGTRNTGEGYGTPMVQATQSNAGWAPGNVLANLSAVQTGGNLNVFLGASAQGNAILLFIDSKSGGHNFIPNNLITGGGEEGTINNLGSSTTAGLTFEGRLHRRLRDPLLGQRRRCPRQHLRPRRPHPHLRR